MWWLLLGTKLGEIVKKPKKTYAHAAIQRLIFKECPVTDWAQWIIVPLAAIGKTAYALKKDREIAVDNRMRLPENDKPALPRWLRRL